MLACTLDIEEEDVLKAVKLYTDALMLLDQYDHQSLEKPEGNHPVYRITYEECCNMVDAMEDTFHSDVFGVEKEKGKVEGIHRCRASKSRSWFKNHKRGVQPIEIIGF